VTITVLSSDHINSLPSGTTFAETWTFTPACDTGPCGGRLVRKGDDLNSGNGKITYQGNGHYAGTDFRLLTCTEEPSGQDFPKAGKDHISFSFHVVKGKVVDGVWQATRIEGTMHADVTPNAVGKAHDCPVAFANESIAGALGA